VRPTGLGGQACGAARPAARWTPRTGRSGRHRPGPRAALQPASRDGRPSGSSAPRTAYPRSDPRRKDNRQIGAPIYLGREDSEELRFGDNFPATRHRPLLRSRRLRGPVSPSANISRHTSGGEGVYRARHARHIRDPLGRRQAHQCTSLPDTCWWASRPLGRWGRSSGRRRRPWRR
jgi:hypothetical protein